MPALPPSKSELEALRATLAKPFEAAKARGDAAEMERLTAIVIQIDNALIDLAFGKLDEAAKAAAEIRVKIEAALQRAKSFPFGLFAASDGAGLADVQVLDLDRPSRASLGESMDDRLDVTDEPRFVTLAEVKHNFKGARPKGIEGAIVHYDAGRSRPTKGDDNLEWGAKNTLLHAQANGFAYATISRSGIIYLPGNMDWEKWGSHAGESECPTTHRKAVSQFYVGFEINSPGLVYPTADADVFVPWFDAVRDGHGKVVLNKRGHATIAKATELYARAQVRSIPSRNSNIRPGFYVPYTDAQQKALFNVLLWLKRSFKKSFRLDFVFGHDEVSPDRKVDPGGALGKTRAAGPGAATTMPELRAELLKAWADQQQLVA